MLGAKTLYLALLIILIPTSINGFPYTNFNSSNTKDDFFFSNDAGVRLGALQITPDNNNNNLLVNRSGRVIYNTPFKLWQPLNSTTNQSASFSTSFLINIADVTLTPGEGIAFVIVPSVAEPPLASFGGYLGLTNETLDGKPSNQIIAVEFDTVKQEANNDPDDNHVGLNINSVKSVATTSLSPLGIKIASFPATNYTVWIDYDGVAHRINVSIASQGVAKPSNPALSEHLDISLYVASLSNFGFAGSTSTNVELNCVLEWNLNVEALPCDDKKDGIAVWIIAVIVIVSIALVMVVGYLVYRRRMKKRNPVVLLGALKRLPGTPKEFKFKELKKATKNFDEKMRLGQGGFGVVYKGVLPEDSTEVAVKKFSRDSTKCVDDFLSELIIINKLRHKHLVKLVGWCHENGVLLLVYDYMPNGSLDTHLFGGPVLKWSLRYNIISGVASALHYLHNEYDERVVHRDLKASNIMLDAAFNARLGDFGLARALETDKTSYAEMEQLGVPGTVGYIAPECFHTGKATRESDVYAFGAVILEIVCGRRPLCDVYGFQSLVDWVWKLHREGTILDAVDVRLAGVYDPEEAQRLLQLGLACSHPAPGERPKAEAVVQIIGGAVAPPLVPPFKPAFIWPAAVVDYDILASTSTISLSATSASWTPHSLSKD
ncbi:probable L-type lectin-domain containing receptor kinase S.5 [Dioscorea cayenensis subsp. rotundata]|uniref:non-specific serine/threonine protein kinase n=1 Tax=Dioscorea cayennensis subsp. rotundata TaxID=55577 RepID=A0AB40BQY0_DIOCR|nr:probable L-type lectin-domain containing receptor kinase S.5 [Dioscorea cayenensis subsp. rotundata]